MLIPLATLPTQPRYCRLTPAVQVPALTCPVSSIAPTARPRRRPVLAGGLIQPGHGEPAHHPHRREGVPHRAAEQPLGPIRRCGPRPARRSSTRCASAGSAHHRGGILARLQPRLCPREARPQQSQQLSAFPARQPGAYPGGSSRLRFCCRHTHDREAAGPIQAGSRSAPRPQAVSVLLESPHGCGDRRPPLGRHLVARLAAARRRSHRRALRRHGRIPLARVRGSRTPAWLAFGAISARTFRPRRTSSAGSASRSSQATAPRSNGGAAGGSRGRNSPSPG